MNANYETMRRLYENNRPIMIQTKEEFIDAHSFFLRYKTKEVELDIYFEDKIKLVGTSHRGTLPKYLEQLKDLYLSDKGLISIKNKDKIYFLTTNELNVWNRKKETEKHDEERNPTET